MILFYVNDLENENVFLEEDEYTHCCKVLRKKVGDQINVTDGKGLSAIATIIEVHKKKALLNIDSTQTHKRIESYLTIALAPPKNRSRWEWFLEKSIEIGADNIIPMRTKNSERVKINIERSHKIIRSAALQSLRYFHPQVTEVTNFEKVVENCDGNSFQKFVAHFKEGNEHLKDCKSLHNQKVILIGPEGDFTPEELSQLAQNNFQEVNISANRLRTETAGLVALNLLMNLKTN